MYERFLDEVRDVCKRTGSSLTYTLLKENGVSISNISRDFGGIKNLAELAGVLYSRPEREFFSGPRESISNESLVEWLESEEEQYVTVSFLEEKSPITWVYLRDRFGSLENFCNLSGKSFLTENDKKYIPALDFYEERIELSKDIKYPQRKYIVFLLACSADNNHIRPNKKLYDSWAKSQKFKLPDSRSIVKAFEKEGGWFCVCRAAGFDIEYDKSCQATWLNFFEKITGVSLQREKSFDNLLNPRTKRKLYFDGYNKDLGLIVEYQDPSHYEKISYYTGDMGLEERQFKDFIKEKWAKDNSYSLLIWPYHLGFNEKLIKQKLSEILEENRE